MTSLHRHGFHAKSVLGKFMHDVDQKERNKKRIKNLLLAKGRMAPSENHFSKFMRFPFLEY